MKRYIEDLETPALIVEEKTLYKNMRTMKELLKGSSLELRPHYKSHKCAQIAKMQIKNGAKGMTCAKLSEAQDLAANGIQDILIANQIVQRSKIEKIAELATSVKLTVCVDHLENVKALSEAAKKIGSTIHCLVEYEIGMKRCGVVNEKEVLELAEMIGSESHLEFDGIQAYAGHISHIVCQEERQNLTADNYVKLKHLLLELEKRNMKAKILSGGSTGTSVIKAKEGLYNELQAGSYIFMDATYKDLKLPFENSLFLLSTVVSERDALTVIDAGVKTCGVDQGVPMIVDGQAREIVLSEEHMQLHGLNVPKQIGDKILLIPGHCCSTMNLHDRIYIVDENRIVDELRITARGCGK